MPQPQLYSLTRLGLVANYDVHALLRLVKITQGSNKHANSNDLPYLQVNW